MEIVLVRLAPDAMKLLKLVLGLDRRAPTITLHKNPNLLLVSDIRKVKIVCFVMIV